MAKRFQVSISDEFDFWLSNLAEETAVGKATMATILLNEARKTRENAVGFKAMFEKMQNISGDEFKQMVNFDLEKLNNKIN